MTAERSVGHNEVQERDVKGKCALVGVRMANPYDDIGALVATGLDALQHRGEEAAGIAYHLLKDVKVFKGLGLRPVALPDDKISEYPASVAAIGHTRYATSGSRNGKQAQLNNAQPFAFDKFAIAENGNVPMMDTSSPSLEVPTSDTFNIGHQLAMTGKPIEEAGPEVLSGLNGGYMLQIVTGEGRVFIASDPWGFKPGSIGLINVGDNYGAVFASETVGLERMGAKFDMAFPRGTFAELTPEGISVIWNDPRVESTPRARCSFEHSYYQDPTSVDEVGRSNYSIRVDLGENLARKAKPTGTLVTEVPLSGIDYAVGVARELNIERASVIKKARYGGRNFIKPRTPDERVRAAFKTFNFVEEAIRGQELIVVDDSVVRANTTQGLILALFELGAERIELLSGMPPLTSPCHWGIDFPSHEELIYNQLVVSPEDSVEYESRLANWLVAGHPELADRLRISFQPLEDYVNIIEGTPMQNGIETSGGCYHCVSGVQPRGTIIPNPTMRS